jgi:hypothetical protein
MKETLLLQDNKLLTLGLHQSQCFPWQVGIKDLRRVQQIHLTQEHFP